MPVRKKECSVCKKKKSTAVGFYKWRAQCIECYSVIRAVKYDKANRREVNVESIANKAVSTKSDNKSLYGKVISPDTDSMRKEIKELWAD